MKKVFDFSQECDKRDLYNFLKTRKPVRYSVEIKQERKHRSNRQNAYYFGVIVNILSKELGCFPDEMHEILKKKFRPKEINIRSTGESFIVGRSTTEDDTFDAEQYYEQIRIWASVDLDILIPLPNESI